MQEQASAFAAGLPVVRRALQAAVGHAPGGTSSAGAVHGAAAEGELVPPPTSGVPSPTTAHVPRIVDGQLVVGSAAASRGGAVRTIGTVGGWAVALLLLLLHLLLGLGMGQHGPRPGGPLLEPLPAALAVSCADAPPAAKVNVTAVQLELAAVREQLRAVDRAVEAAQGRLLAEISPG